MADEDDEFFEAYEDLPQSPTKKQIKSPQGTTFEQSDGGTEASVKEPVKPDPGVRSLEQPVEQTDSIKGSDRGRSYTVNERSAPGGDGISQAESRGEFSRERSATVGSAPQPFSGFDDADLSIWRSGPSSVRERRERFWQTQGGGPLPGANTSNLPPPGGSLPARRGSANQDRVNANQGGFEGDRKVGGIAKRRSSEGERRLTIGFDSKPQGLGPNPQLVSGEAVAGTAVPPPVAFVVSSQGAAPIADVSRGRGGSGLTSALADLAPKLTSASNGLGSDGPKAITASPEETRARAETAPAQLRSGGVPEPRAYSYSSETGTSGDGVNKLEAGSRSEPAESRGPPTTSTQPPLAIPASQQPNTSSSNNPATESPSDQFSSLTLPPLGEISHPVRPIETAKARPWPKRHTRTSSGSDPESHVTPPLSGGASPPAPKSPLQQGVNAAKQLLGQVASHLSSNRTGDKSLTAKTRWDGLPASTTLERDVLRLGGGPEAEPRSAELAGADVAHAELAGSGQDSPVSLPRSSDVFYRIKNLDTGREFLMEGEGNKVKDARSGKELSLDEIEDSLGLSPVFREVRRREMEGADVWSDVISGSRDSESDPGSGALPKKKRGWLNKTLKKGAAYYEKGRRRLQRDPDTEGSGSDTDRRPFVHGRGPIDARVAGYGPGYEPGPNGKGSVKVHVQRKAYKELTDVRVGQEIKAHEGSIWCMKFNSDGRFLATGGSDGLVKIWEVVDKLPPTPLQASGDFDELVSASGRLIDDSATDEDSRRTSRDRSNSWGASFWLADVAYRTLRGHSSDVLDVSWSKNTQFLLSSSMDKTVRLWHISMDECLRVFPHSDFVTCLDFNPADDKYFVSGSLDNKVRIWNIPEHRVVDWTDMREMVTACTYTADGSGAVVGSYEGTCRFYNTSKHMLQLDGTLDVRSTRGKNAQGKKVTGVQCMPGDPRKILVTSNDSRLRVYDGMKLECKYRGHTNNNSPLVAAFSVSGEYLVCPSEDGFVYVWGTANSYVPPYGGFRRDRHQSCEYFYSSGVSVAVAWGGPKSSSSDSDGSQGKFRSRASSAGNGEITSASGVRVPGKTAREVPLGSWPREALAARRSGGVPGGRVGPGPWAEPQAESDRLESASVAASEASAVGEAAVAAGAAMGLVIVTASHQGEIRTFKNFGRPVWL